MPQTRQILLKSRPVGLPRLEHFQMVELQVPEPSDGEVLTRTLFLSLDPYMRGRMNDTESYAAPYRSERSWSARRLARSSPRAIPALLPVTSSSVSATGRTMQFSAPRYCANWIRRWRRCRRRF